ncbi:MAG: hypothetical protein GF353_03690 [Candidatus Lokiarchaeota archaeon]|nr:hypothetical protein [Candidatus Lokiarchaeota archaeon]
MGKRKKLSDKLKTEILIANRHACCVCAKANVQVHHINSDNSDNRWENLAVLCFNHHDKATAPLGLSACLTPEQVSKYKSDWEKKCEDLNHIIARSRTSFFMVDYNNAERIRQAYATLNENDRQRCYIILLEELKEENNLREEQGFNVSLEPNTKLTPTVQRFLGEILIGTSHPTIFDKAKGHENDPLFPDHRAFEPPQYKQLYEIWCQIMVRCLLICKGCYDLDSLMLLENPNLLKLDGALVSFKAPLKGKVYPPSMYNQFPLSETNLTAKNKFATWTANLKLKTHYIYSATAADSLGDSTKNGILVLRNIEKIKKFLLFKRIAFSAVPLIIGNGVLEIPEKA